MGGTLIRAEELEGRGGRSEIVEMANGKEERERKTVKGKWCGGDRERGVGGAEKEKG